jgi:hypothetical protein
MEHLVERIGVEHLSIPEKMLSLRFVFRLCINGKKTKLARGVFVEAIANNSRTFCDTRRRLSDAMDCLSTSLPKDGVCH